MSFFELKSHDYLQNFVELVGGAVVDVLGTGIEVSSDVSGDGKMGVDRGGITFEDFKDKSSRVGKPSRIRSSSDDCMVEDSLHS